MNRQSEDSLRACVNYAYETLASKNEGFLLSDFLKLIEKMTDHPQYVVDRLGVLGLFEVRDSVILLLRDGNDISSDNFPRLKDRYFFYPECESTMDEAAKLASEGASDFTVVVAESQGSGRGRNGRQWISAPGGIYCSIILKPDTKPELCFKLNYMVCSVLVSYLRDVYGVDALCKWPNDILAGGGKLAGMISDSVIEGSRVKYIVIGLGINVNNALPEVGQPVSSLKSILGYGVSRRAFFDGFLIRLEKAYSEFSSKDWIAETRKFSATIGRKVTIEKPGKTFSGEAVGVDDDGLLLVRVGDANIIKVASGDCIHSYCNLSI